MAQLLSGTRIYGTGTIDTQLFVNGTTITTSTNTGALTVSGGVGVGGALYVANTSYIAGAQIITTATVGNYAAATSGPSITTASLINSEFGWAIDGAGFSPSLGDKAVMVVPFNCYITSATVIANTTGSALIYISTSTVATWPARTAISGSTINLVNASYIQINTASWTNTLLTTGQLLLASLQTVNTVTFLTISLQVTKQ
jgi:hypothetical protein